ncbi:MAG: bifunctional UDP-N-acetylglucosamine diphosphorylase/glucosamine-1-phosphate N-acetyltransferase GlmU [Proteobacteria bacterium]|nr:bifunctional UDP-N-acetylglucosamine diphosphorylase/glucosamine-1-phosphate N-acetyltransferase GlmU [Pseudomonadota bacterium]
MSTDRFAAVILAAGKGTRMESDRPKVLHGLAGRPMINHLLATVGALGPERVLVVVAPGMDAVAQAVAPARTVVQKEQLGTGHAVMAAREGLAGFEGTVLVLYADTPLLSGGTITRVLEASRAGGGAAITVLGFRPGEPNEYARLIVSGGELERIVEFKDAGDADLRIELCNSGVMAIDGSVLDGLLRGVGAGNAKGEYYLTDLVALARGRGLRCVAVEGPADELLGINSRAELAAAEAVVQRGLRARAMAGGVTMIDPDSVWLSYDTTLGRDVTVEPNVYFGPGTSVGDGATIRAFSHFEGASIAADAIVGPFARLRPGARVGTGAKIGNFVEIKQTDVQAGAKVNHLTYLGDTVVGAKANVGAGTITCNYDGYTKAQTHIGAGAFIGSNATLIAPLRIGDGAYIAAGSTVTDDVPDDALALARERQVTKPGRAAKLRARLQAAKAAKT